MKTVTGEQLAKQIDKITQQVIAQGLRGTRNSAHYKAMNALNEASRLVAKIDSEGTVA